MVGSPAPYREAVEARLADLGLLTTGNDKRVLVMIQCDCEEHWERLAREGEDPNSVAVAVLPSLVLDSYVRALCSGASGVVYIDTPSLITAEAVQAAVNGEVLLPRQAAQSLAMLARRLRPTTELDEAETLLLRSVASGRTIVDLAHETFFSERTVRRHLQSLYLKLGVRNRAEAIAAATRMGVLD